MTNLKSVAIVALADPTVPVGYDEIWTINDSHARYGIDTDMIIAMDDLERDVDVHPDYVDRIVNAGVPVLSTEEKDQWPDVEAYPLREVCDFIMQYHGQPWEVLDNSCNYAFSLALAREYTKIGLFGFAWCAPYKRVDLECARVRFQYAGYDNPPNWFQYYHPSIMVPRRPLEPGVESFHFFLGVASAMGIKLRLPPACSILNHDRRPYFYGYTEQPDLLAELLNE